MLFCILPGHQLLILYPCNHAMSGRLISHRLGPLFARGGAARRFFHGNVLSRTGGILRNEGNPAVLRRRQWPLGSYAIHNVPAVRSISFGRILPKLAVKLARIPAMFGGALLAGLAYVQYQAARKSSIQGTLFILINIRQRLVTMRLTSSAVPTMLRAIQQTLSSRAEKASLTK